MCPTLFVKGGKIVEVALTEWKQTGLMTWSPVKADVTVELPGSIDGIIFETPVGCWRMDMLSYADTLTLNMGGGIKQRSPFYLCKSKPSFAAEVGLVLTKGNNG